MIVRAISWNLFHGRDAPPNPALHTWRSRLLKISEHDDRYVQVNRSLFAEFCSALAQMTWDIALLQECPPRWAAPLADSLGAQGHRVLTSRNWLPRVSALAATLNPDLIGSAEGGSNLTLVRGELLAANDAVFDERREFVIRERRPERRTMGFARTRAGLCIANLHATNDRPELAAEEVMRAASAAVEWAGSAPLLFGGDLNMRPSHSPEVFAQLRERFGLAGAIAESIDHLLVRGADLIDPPHPLDHPEVAREAGAAGPLGLWRREIGRRIRLSDHDPEGAALRIEDRT